VQHAALAQIGANRAGVLQGDDPEYLHQLRVGMRRLRSALRAFRDVLPRKERKSLARRTRRVMRKLGAARDWDVFLAWLETQKPPRALLLRAQREQADARLRAKRELSRLSVEPIEAHAKDLDAAAVLERLERKARKPACGTAKARHKLRIHVKRLRYASEFFGRPRPGLERLQKVLGELNDVEVARRLLRGLGVEAPGLYRALDERERRLLASLAKTKTSSFGHASGRRG